MLDTASGRKTRSELHGYGQNVQVSRPFFHHRTGPPAAYVAVAAMASATWMLDSIRPEGKTMTPSSSATRRAPGVKVTPPN
jgi:hypothetical protein